MARGPQPGDLIEDRYRLDLMIGTGGMGAVWSAGVDGTDDKIALKFLHSQLASDPLMVQRFLLEARAGMDIKHPNVVKVIAQGRLEPTDPRDDAMPWLAMELLTGKTLGDALRLRGRLEPVDALAIMADVTAGTAAAHAKGIVHRDIKPGNVFLQQVDGKITPKLLDFGISKYVDPSLDGGLTSTGAIVGSATYMSPEQAAGGYNVDTRTDVWSLGVMLYRLLTGESPLGVSQQPEVIALLASAKELELGALKNPRIPPTVADIVRRCLRKKREERWPSAVELETELKAALAAEAVSSRSPDIDTLLRPASSAATFIAAPMDATPEPTAATAPTGVPATSGYVVDPRATLSPATEQVQAPAASVRGTMKMDVPYNGVPASALETVRIRPESTSSIWAKVGAIALGIGIVAVGGTAWRLQHRAQPAPAPTFTNPEPLPSASAEPVEVEDEPETSAAPETTAQPPTVATSPKAVRQQAKGRQGSKGTKPPASAESWRKPGF